LSRRLPQRYDIGIPNTSLPAEPRHVPTTPLIDIATRDLATLGVGGSIGEAADLMAGRRISSIVVTDDRGSPAGIVTERNVVQAMQTGCGREAPLLGLMSSPVITVAESVTCLDAYRMCLRKGIRHLVLTDAAGAAAGVVSETDFRLHMHLTALAGRRLVTAAMSRTVLSLPPEASLRDALSLLEAQRGTCVVVAQNNRPVGIVTERDIVHLYAHGADRAGVSLRDVMTAPPKTVSVDATVGEAAEQMLAARLRHLVVVDPAGELAGTISEHDLTQTMALGMDDARHDVESALLHTLIDTIPDLVWLKDTQGVFLACNPKFERLVGAKEADIIGKTDYDFVSREMADDFLRHDRMALGNDGPCVNEEWVTYADDGHRELLETIKTPMRDRDGRLIGVLGIARDITQRAWAEQAQRESEEKLRTLIAAMPDSVQFKDAGGRWLAFNGVAQAAFGLEGADCHGRSDAELAEIADPMFKNALLQCHATDEVVWQAGTTSRVEEIIPQPDGTSLFFDVIKVPLLYPNGNRKGLVIIGRDMTERRRAELALEDNLRFAKQLIEVIPSPVFYKDHEGRYLGCNEAYEQFIGKRREEIVGKTPHDIAPKALADRYLAADRNLFEHPGTQVYEAAVHAADGSDRDVVFHKATFTRADGRIGGLVGVILDVTERKKTEDSLRLAASVFANSLEGIVITDAEARIVDVNEGFTSITGYSRDEVLGKNPKLLSAGRQDPLFYHEMWRTLRAFGAWRGEIWNRRKSGEVYAEMLSVAEVRDQTGRLQNYVGVFTDISRHKEHEAELDRIAHYDTLTGVPNRRLLADRMNQDIARARRTGKPMAVCYLDLDGFKPINDRFGHDAGDQLLINVSRSLQSALRAGDTVARLGGDEFVLLLNDLEQARECFNILDRVLLAVGEPTTIGEAQVSMSASVGVTLFPQDDADADTLLRHCDQAMYQAKEAGKNRYHLFDPENDRKTKARRESLQRLAEAFENEEFTLHYQPKVDLSTRQVVGAEALLRWRHPQRGLLAPAEFLDVLAGTHLDVALGEWVIAAVLRQIDAWRASGHKLRVSANISAYHLQRPDFAQRLQLALARHPRAVADDLELEILESAAIGDMEHASHTLEAGIAMGVHFSLDDFGTGYSSLTYFRRLPVETLKIDQTFVRDMLDDAEARRIVESVVRLALGFNRSVIAEGVETEAHGELLVQLGCNFGQGYGIAAPMPPENLPDWIVGWHR
jgi:diguanylate cyclase (GGDEF)-like protein/PAS domain S-box-containing protein